MGLGLTWGVVAIYGAGLGALYLFGRIFAMPIKWILRLLANALLGGAVLIAINVVGGPLGFHIGINPVTALVVGLLGLPGVLLLLLLSLLL